MISKHELFKIAIVSTSTILIIVNLVGIVLSAVEDPQNTTVEWQNATDICQGIPLTYGEQLNAVGVNLSGTIVPGTYYYNPDVGTVLSAGQHQPLNVTFVPGNLTAYNNSSKTVYINVNQCPEEHGFFHQTEYSTFLPFQWG